MKKYIKRLQRKASRFWFSPLLLILALLDVFFVVIPADGLLISSSMLIKRRWGLFAISMAIGSSLGALIFAALVKSYGMGLLLQYFPAIDQSHQWMIIQGFFNDYGNWAVFIIGLTPISQQPILALAALSGIVWPPFILAVISARVIKFSIMAYVATHAPRFLKKLWGIKGELKEVGVKIE